MPTYNKDRHGRIDRVIVEDDEKNRTPDLPRMNLVPPPVGIFDEPSRCYRLNNEWAKIIMGLVKWLAATPVWRDAENEGYFAIEEVMEFMVGFDCPQFEVRSHPANPCVLEFSDDGGEIWQEFADFSDCTLDSTNSYYTQLEINLLQAQIYLIKYIEGDQRSININAPLIIFNGDDGGTPTFFREEALCMAAQIFVGSFAARKVQEIEAKMLGIGFLIAGFAWITGGIGLLAGMALGLLLAPTGIHWFNARTALLDESALQDVACCMYEDLRGKAVTEANFKVSVDSCGFTYPTNLWIVAALVEASIQEKESYLAFLDALGREFIAASVGGVNDCNCTGTFIHTFDFTANDGGWEIMTARNRPYGVWESGVGWKSVYGGVSQGIPNDERLYIKRIGWTRRFITRVELWYTSTGVEGGPNRNQSLLLYDSGSPGNNKNFGGFIVPDSWMETTDPDDDADEITIVTVGDSDSDNCEIVCTQIKVYGEGSNPFI